MKSCSFHLNPNQKPRKCIRNLSGRLVGTPLGTPPLYMTQTIMSGAIRADAGEDAPSFDVRGLALPSSAHGLLFSASWSPPVPTCVLTALMKSNSSPAPATMPTEGILVTLGASSSSAAFSASSFAVTTAAHFAAGTVGVVVVGCGRARFLLAVALTLSNSAGSSTLAETRTGAGAALALALAGAEADEMTLTGEGARETGGVGT
mmetsp:Transcript_93170/g.266234  ORF Transcript_93170/g.266234 Transcript_93170/m.266234 type:complete len:205 (+) Transcript_93170:199-813(+)